ncbi:MAG: hypothetical protein HYU58_15245 [Proteobacteria bacterium]|nr:hypothetical protein [Pseudomonadota bacterium]
MSSEAESEAIDDPVGFFASLGGLHDVRINGITIDVEEQILLIYVDDLYWGLDGSPEYPGERPCVLAFLGVTGVKFDFDMVDGVRIHHVQVNENISATQPFALGITLNIGGVSPAGKSLIAMFNAVEIEDLDA